MNERDSTRRTFLKQSIAVAGLSLAAPAFLRSAAWAAGSDAPEKTDLRIGFIPLTDCASVVVAATQGFGSKYGLNITPSKEASWAGVRDKLNTGELDAAHVLYGMMYGAQLGDRKSTRLNSSHVRISYAVFCLKKKKNNKINTTKNNQ